MRLVKPKGDSTQTYQAAVYLGSVCTRHATGENTFTDMPYRASGGRSRHRRLRSRSAAPPKSEPVAARNQPVPSTPGITKQMVRDHACRMFRDKWPSQPLSAKEWRLAEQDLVGKLEAEAY